MYKIKGRQRVINTPLILKAPYLVLWARQYGVILVQVGKPNLYTTIVNGHTKQFLSGTREYLLSEMALNKVAIVRECNIDDTTKEEKR